MIEASGVEWEYDRLGIGEIVLCFHIDCWTKSKCINVLHEDLPVCFTFTAGCNDCSCYASPRLPAPLIPFVSRSAAWSRPCVLGFPAIIPLHPPIQWRMYHGSCFTNEKLWQKFSNLLKVTMVRKWQSQEFWLSSEFLLPHVVSLLKGKSALGLKVRASNCSISGHRTSEFTLSLCKENLGNGGGSTFGIQWINSPLTAVSL